MYLQVSYLLASEKTIEREFRPLLLTYDQFPKYVVSLDKIDMSHQGIHHRNLIEFLRQDEI